MFEANDIEPTQAETALEHIAAMYAAEEHIRKNDMKVAAKRGWRQAHAKPVVERFFKWVEKYFEAQGFLPSSPFTKALNYIRERREGLAVYLDDPDVPIDTNPRRAHRFKATSAHVPSGFGTHTALATPGTVAIPRLR